MRQRTVTTSLAVAVCLLALSPEAVWIPPGPANDLPAGGLLSQRPADIPPDGWRRILQRIERDGYAVRPVAEVGAERAREEAILRASDAQAADRFGISVAISRDTALVGARIEAGGPGDLASLAGAAYVFGRNQGGMNNWGEIKKLTASDAQAGDEFGISVAISGDTALVGAFGEDGGPGDPASVAGAAYVFERNQGGMNNWGEVVKFSASDAQADDQFGGSVAISGDTIIVGAVSEDGGPGDPLNRAGAAYMFRESFFRTFIAGLPEPGRVPVLTPPE